MSRKMFSMLSAVSLIVFLALSPGLGLAEELPPDPPAGPVFEATFSYDEGTHFEVTDSGYLNVTLDSSEAVRVLIESVPEVVTINIEPLGAATSTQLTIGGLVPNTAYYLYVDDLHDAQAFTTDSAGRYYLTQDISVAHTIHILTGHSTWFLSDNATGGDCTSIGIWDSATRTCTLTGDVDQTIQIDSNYITLDGNGYTVTCESGSYGVYLYSRRYVGVKNLTVSGCNIGLYASYSSFNTIEDNTFTGNNGALVLSMIPQGNVVARNTVVNNGYTGIACYYACYGNTFDGNFLQFNQSGFYMWDGFNNVYTNNTVDSTIGTYWRTAGINQLASSNNLYEGNTFSNNVSGLAIIDATYCPYSYCGGSGNNVFRYNNIVGNYYAYATSTGFNKPSPTPHNQLYLNNFVDNTLPLYDSYGFVNYFNLALPTGGNYWSEHDSPAEGCIDGNADGFCDAPYVLSTVIQDNYPRTSPVAIGQPPVLSLPADITAEATGPEGAIVTYTATADDDQDGSVPVTCAPASGSVFSIGVTEVDCSASDSAGNTTEGSFTVTVQDTTPPAITCPAGISVLLNTPATDAAITAFLDGATATDAVDQDVTVINNAPSAYDTPGTVTVAFTATDDYANTSTCSSAISVQYGFSGFLQPVSLLKPFKFGSTVPVKFQLTDYSGSSVSTANAVIALVQATGAEPVGDPIDGTSNVPDAGNAFRYDAAEDVYIYNLSTDQLSIGTWNLVVTLDDGTTESIEFKLK